MDKPNDQDFKSFGKVCGYFFWNFVNEVTKEFVEKMQINRGLQFPIHDGNFSGFTSNINNGYPSSNETNMMNDRGFGGLDNNIWPSNDVMMLVASNYVPLWIHKWKFDQPSF